MKYYLYRHIRLDKNEPFYIGIGSKTGKYFSYKIEYRRAYNFAQRNEWWKSIFNKTTIIVEILFESDNYNFIKEKEKEFIKLYKNTLCNLTDGGEGVTGYIHSEESKNKMRKLTPDKIKALKKLHNTNIGRIQSDFQKQRVGETNSAIKVKSISIQDMLSTEIFYFDKIGELLSFLNLKSYSALSYYKKTGNLLKKKYLLL